MENFTEKLKQEILLESSCENCAKMVFFALLYFSSSFEREGGRMLLKISFPSIYVYRKIFPLLSSLQLEKDDLQCVYNRKNVIKRIELIIRSESFEDKKLLEYHFNKALIRPFLKDACCFRTFIKTVFLLKGSIVNPDKQYFLEINFGGNDKIAGMIIKRLKKNGITIRKNNREESLMLYLKRFDEIIRFLHVLQCPKFIMFMQDRSLVKEIRNNTNRKINCDMNNLNRTVNTGISQATLFQEILDSKYYGKLDEISRRLIKARIKNPDVSYVELGEILELTKAQVSYYIKKINRKYLKYKNNLVNS
ncbi:MAG: DNA-binding protein WhiA [Candidatus Muiribacterium halophilum]|uniref:DNA-binding protein WhiA n=1 Tax=Muiribacterium halophilum TaxID=2053465 RepID=A0A2N5ZE07_MUIH1|nr:MAG: DNA-binding protein WhiA [Candidatus Muirbacterium halophilum]